FCELEFKVAQYVIWSARIANHTLSCRFVLTSTQIAQQTDGRGRVLRNYSRQCMALFCECCQSLRRCQFISCFPSGSEFLCFLLGRPLMLHMWRELYRVSILSINQKSVSPKPKIACGCSCLRPMRRPISSGCLR